MSRRTIRKAAVLGAGVMGSRIAALLAGVDIPTYLLDIVPRDLDEQDVKKGLTKESPDFRNKLAKMGIQGTIGVRPPAMFIADDAKLITPGNFEDHLQWLADADWVIEGVVEDIGIKKELLRKIEPFLKPALGVGHDAALQGSKLEGTTNGGGVDLGVGAAGDVEVYPTAAAVGSPGTEGDIP